MLRSQISKLEEQIRHHEERGQKNTAAHQMLKQIRDAQRAGRPAKKTVVKETEDGS